MNGRLSNRGYLTILGALLLILVVGGTPLDAAATPALDWHTTVRQFAMEHFKQPAWGYSHSVRDYAPARELAAADQVILDDDVLFAASFLHDIAAFKPWEDEKRDHSDVGADVVPDILKDTGFPMDKIDAVRGAIGVARVMALVDPNGGLPDGPAAVQMLEENLAKVPSRVLSPAGREYRSFERNCRNF